MSVYKRFSMGTRSFNDFFVFPLFWCLLLSLWSRIDWYRVIASTHLINRGGVEKIKILGGVVTGSRGGYFQWEEVAAFP